MFPVLLAVWFMSLLEKQLRRVIPDALDLILTPLFTVITTRAVVMRCLPPCVHAWVAALFVAACGLLEGVLRYMSQYHLLESDIHIASFDDHYLYDSLSVRIDTVVQDIPLLAQNCFNIITKMIDGDAVAELQRFLPATIHWRSAYNPE